jgi:hypothetical protein
MNEVTDWEQLAREMARVLGTSNPELVALLMAPLPEPPPEALTSSWY